MKLEQVICIFDSAAGDCYLSLKREGEKFVEPTKINKTKSDLFGFWLNGVTSSELRLAEKVRRSGLVLENLQPIRVARCFKPTSLKAETD